MKKINVRFLAESAIIAALYVAVTWLMAPISYGPIQFRISEALILLVIFNSKYTYSLILGCLIANSMSNLGAYDVVFGTLATILGILPMTKIKKMGLACIFPILSNSLIVSLELYIVFKESHLFWYNILTIAFGEAIVLYLIGIPLMISIAKNEQLSRILQLDVRNLSNTKILSLSKSLYVVVGVLGIIFYVAFPMYRDENGNVLRAIDLTKQQLWIGLFFVFSLLYVIIGLVTKKSLRLSLGLMVNVSLVILYIVFAVTHPLTLSFGYFFGYIMYLIIMLSNSIYIYYHEVLKKKLI